MIRYSTASEDDGRGLCKGIHRVNNEAMDCTGVKRESSHSSGLMPSAVTRRVDRT